MKQILILTLFSLTTLFSFSQLDYAKMKDTIYPTLCGFHDSTELTVLYQKLLTLDTTTISKGMEQYYDDLSHAQYELYLYNTDDTTFMRLSLASTLKSLHHDPKGIGMLWNAAFGYTVFGECDKTHYYLARYAKACPRRFWKGEQKNQIAILLQMCPNEELKRKFRINE